jgi:aspartate-semialdehyde dehydrogenase
MGTRRTGQAIAPLGPYIPDRRGVFIGRVRQCPVLDIKFVVLSNIGAATSSIMNAKMAILKGFITM